MNTQAWRQTRRHRRMNEIQDMTKVLETYPRRSKMSRIHPTHEELERKSKNIEIERAKTSDFRPTIIQGKVEPHPEKVREAQNTSWLSGSILLSHVMGRFLSVKSVRLPKPGTTRVGFVHVLIVLSGLVLQRILLSPKPWRTRRYQHDG